MNPNREAILALLDVPAFYTNEGVQLKDLGAGQFQASCPFHDDANPSFSVGPNGVFFCHAGCGGGSVFDFYARKHAVDIAAAFSAVALLAEPKTKLMPAISESEILAWASALLLNPQMVTFLHDERGYTDDTIKKFELGWDGDRITIPVRDAEGVIVNVRRYLPHPTKGQAKFLSFKEGYGAARLFNVAALAFDNVVLCEGEMDCILLAQEGFHAVTATGGAGTWKGPWTPLFAGKKVVICYDHDRAGRLGAKTVAEQLSGTAAPISTVEWPATFLKKGDVTDFLVTLGNSVDELAALLASAPPFIATEPGKRGDRAGAGQLVELALAADPFLFHTPDGQPFISVGVGDHRETWSIRSRSCSLWLQRLFYVATSRAASDPALKQAVGQLEAKAQFDGPEQAVHLRVAATEAAVYLDLANESWAAVEVTKDGWTIVPEPPVRFRRPNGMLALPTPVAGGTIDELRPFINVTDADWVLVCGWLLASLRPSGPFFILCLFGEQGSAKTTTARTLRALIDPNFVSTGLEPKNTDDLMIAALNDWILSFDNLSYVPRWLSDALCVLATGGGVRKRELYSNLDEVLFNATRPVIINGISEVATRSDLLHRTLLIECPPIGDGQRETEAELGRRFRAAAPRILGALLDAVSASLANIADTTLSSTPRMADATTWVTAGEARLGLTPEEFLRAYLANRHDVDAVALDSSILTPFIEKLVAEVDFTGAATDLLNKLNELRAGEKVADWPKTANHLSGRLRRLAPNLRSIGIDVIQPKRVSHDKARKITIKMTKRTSKPEVSTDEEPGF
jgi:hypothetical protein